MLGISFSEFIVIFLVAVVFIKPEDIPSLVKSAKTLLKKVNMFKEQYNKTISDISSELDLDEEEETKFILDESGKPHLAYDIEDLKAELPQSKDKIHYN